MSQLIDETVARLVADPSAGKSQPTVSAEVEDGAARLVSGSFSWISDLPPPIGGGNTAPSPTAYLLGALAGCAVAFIRDTLAPQLGVPLNGISAVARASADTSGLLGIEGADPRLSGFSIDITIDSPADPMEIERLQQAWLDRCPVYLSLVEPTEVTVSWS